MSNGRALKLWTVNVLSFILFFILTTTGLLNWLLPRGYEARGSVLVSLRHLIITIHEWTALLFMILMVIHMVLHWSYIKSNLKKYGVMK